MAKPSRSRGTAQPAVESGLRVKPRQLRQETVGVEFLLLKVIRGRVTGDLNICRN